MITTVNSITPIKKVFISYSPENAQAKDELLKVLRGLVAREQIKVWTDQNIAPGEVREAEMVKALDESDIAVLILTVAYLASPEYQFLLPKLRSAHDERRLKIVPIRWSAFHLEADPWLPQLQLLPRSGESVNRALDRDQVLTEIAKEIAKLICVDTSRATPSRPEVAAPSSVSASSQSTGSISAPPTPPEMSVAPNAEDAYVVKLEADATSVDILTLVEGLKQEKPRAWLWTSGAFKGLTPGRGDRRTPDRMLRVSWTPNNVVTELNPVGFTNGQQLKSIVYRLDRSSNSEQTKKFYYYPFGNAQPDRYEIEVRFGRQIHVLITDISSTLPDLKRSPTLQLIWSGVGNKGGSTSE